MPPPEPAAEPTRRRQRRRPCRTTAASAPTRRRVDRAPGRRRGCPTPVVGDTAERDIRVETDARHRVVHEPRRAAQELAAEAIPRSAGQPFELVVNEASDDAAASVLAPRRRCGGHAHAERRAVRRARCAAVGSRVEPARRSALRVPRQRRPARRQGISDSSPPRTSSASAPRCTRAIVRWRRRSSGAPASATEPSATGSYVLSARGHRFDCRRRRARPPLAAVAEQPTRQRRLSVRRRRRPLLHRGRARARDRRRSRSSP